MALSCHQGPCEADAAAGPLACSCWVWRGRSAANARSRWLHRRRRQAGWCVVSCPAAWLTPLPPNPSPDPASIPFSPAPNRSVGHLIGPQSCPCGKGGAGLWRAAAICHGGQGRGEGGVSEATQRSSWLLAWAMLLGDGPRASALATPLRAIARNERMVPWHARPAGGGVALVGARPLLDI